MFFGISISYHDCGILASHPTNPPPQSPYHNRSSLHPIPLPSPCLIRQPILPAAYPALAHATKLPTSTAQIASTTSSSPSATSQKKSSSANGKKEGSVGAASPNAVSLRSWLTSQA